MQQVKLFSDDSYAYGPNDSRNGLRNIEREINAWLAQNSDKEIARGGQNSLTAKIAMIFDNDPEWKKSDHCKLFGHRKKGYKRV